MENSNINNKLLVTSWPTECDDDKNTEVEK